MGLKIRSNRIGLKCLEQVQFDDHEFDAKVLFPGQDRSWRPRCFGLADVLTSIYDICCKPTFWDPKEESKKALTETDFTWFVVRALTEIGFRTDSVGTAFCVEHGLAAIRGNKALPLGDSLRDELAAAHLRTRRAARSAPARGGPLPYQASARSPIRCRPRAATSVSKPIVEASLAARR
jgi:hypothetical protein